MCAPEFDFCDHDFSHFQTCSPLSEEFRLKSIGIPIMFFRIGANADQKVSHGFTMPQNGMKMMAKPAADVTYCTAAAATGTSAARVSFRRLPPAHPLRPKPPSAGCSAKSAAQIGGNSAIYAANAVTAAAFAALEGYVG